MRSKAHLGPARGALLALVLTHLHAEASAGVQRPPAAIPRGEQSAPATATAQQRPPSDPRRAGVLAAAAADLKAFLNDPELLLFDQPEGEGGAIWVRGTNFKAAFAPGGWTFIPKPAAGVTRHEEIELRLAGASVGTHVIETRAARPTRADRRIRYDHGGLVQTLDCSARGVEQSFVFARLPARGALRVELELITPCTAAECADGIELRGASGKTTYSSAIAFDARGERTAATTRLADGHIEIEVPADFVAHATLPLTIDPLVTHAVPATGNTDLGDPDVCCLQMTEFPSLSQVPVWNVVYSNYFGANEWDVYVQRYDEDLVALGAPIVIDLTSSSWARPRIASIRSQMLVVAQARTGTDPWSIVGRSLRYSGFSSAAPTVGSQFAIVIDSVDCIRPDVGGNASAQLPFLPVYFTVVWEIGPASDHDIYARLVDWNDNLVGPWIAIANTTLYQSNPAISKSCGDTPTGSPGDARFGVVYQQRTLAGNEDVHGALLTHDGQHVLVNGNPTFPIDTSFHHDIAPQISSPTRWTSTGRRILLAVYERTTSGNGDIVGTCIDQSGRLLASGNISVLENDPVRAAWPQHRPAVDSDGIRFGVGYHEDFQGLANDPDTRVSLVALAGSSLVVQEPAVLLGGGGNREFNVQIASEYSGLPCCGSRSSRYCATNDRDNLNNSFAIDVYTYDGIPANTLNTRSTGCGSVSIMASGSTRLGASLSFSLSSSANSQGFFVGLPVDLPIAACPGCKLGAHGVSLFASQYVLGVPVESSLIGVLLAVQGFELAPSGGPCLSLLHLSDTVDFTIQ